MTIRQTMRVLPTPAFSLLVAAALLCSALPVAAQDYAIKLSRPVKVADKAVLSYKFDGSMHVVVSVGDKKAQDNDQKTAADFSGEMEVVAISKHGDPTKFNFTIASGTVTKMDGTAVTLTKGQVLVADSKDGKPQVTAKAGELDGEVASILAEALNPAKDKRPNNDDDFIGTKEKVKVGGTWNIDGKVAAENMLKASDIQIRPEDISGSGKLIEVTKKNDVEAMSVAIEMVAKDAKFALPDQLKAFQMEKSQLKANFRATLPTDVAKAPLDRGIDMSVSIVLKQATENGEVTFQMDQVRHTTITYAAAK